MSEKPIAILALNPSVDISYTVQQLVTDQKVRAQNTRYYAGGNGINVARALAELQLPLRCFSILAGESGYLLLRLLGDALGENHQYFFVDGETRLNAIIHQKNPPGQYEVDSHGAEVSPETLAEVTAAFIDASKNGIGVLSGSLPPGVLDDTYQQLTEQIQSYAGRAVIDIHGPVLQQALEAKPYLVRVNRYSLEMTIKKRLESIESVALAAREIQQSGIAYVAVSLGADGAILLDADSSFHCKAPKVKVSSTVGCGDAMVAGMLKAIQEESPTREMLRCGVACGSATTSHPGTELFNREELDNISLELDIEELEI